MLKSFYLVHTTKYTAFKWSAHYSRRKKCIPDLSASLVPPEPTSQQKHQTWSPWRKTTISSLWKVGGGEFIWPETKQQFQLLFPFQIQLSLFHNTRAKWKKKKSFRGLDETATSFSCSFAENKAKTKQDEAGARVGAPCSGRLLVKLKERDRGKHLISATSFHFNSCTFLKKQKKQLKKKT